jgi:hypothetical protein
MGWQVGMIFARSEVSSTFRSFVVRFQRSSNQISMRQETDFKRRAFKKTDCKESVTSNLKLETKLEGRLDDNETDAETKLEDWNPSACSDGAVPAN